MKRLLFAALVLIMAGGCNNTTQETKDANAAIQAEVQQFLVEYTAKYQELSVALSETQWKANTMIIEGDSATTMAATAAGEALAAFSGSKENIEKTQKYLLERNSLTPLQVKQLEAFLYAAADNPEIAGDLVSQRIKAEDEQNAALFGFDFKIDGKSVSTNDIDGILKASTDINERKQAWEASKEVGTELKGGLKNLRNLRNQTVQALGYNDYFTYQVSDYGMTNQEMMDLNKKLIREIWPLYRELHTWTRYELAAKYGEEVPDMLPAHWLPNRWGQDFGSLVEVEGINLDGVLEEKGDEWMVKQAERFYVSLGFDPLPQSFWEKSSLYPAPEDAEWKKNNHASAWHIDLNEDVRCLMSVVPNTEWYETTHHEYGHIYYYMSYSTPDVPLVLRGGANRAYHEAIGSMLGLAAMQKPFMEGLGLIEPGQETDEQQTLLKEALNYIVFMPWGGGVMTEFEHDLYVKDLSEDEFNQRWWDLKAKYQGIVPPTERGEEYCDAASKTHINNDAAQYYDYALSYVLLFQFHDYIAKQILKQDPHATNYYGNKEVGKFLTNLLSPGATRDWRELTLEFTGEEMSARAMLEYFMPLMDYLKQVNEGRAHTLPEMI